MAEDSNDPTIGDDEALLRGLLGRHIGPPPAGAVHPAAFVPRERECHLSVFRESYCEPLRLFKKTLRNSRALGRLFAGRVRQLAPEVVGIGRDAQQMARAVVGIGRDAEQSQCHVLILRQKGFGEGYDPRWLPTAQRLADLCEVSHLNPKK